MGYTLDKGSSQPSSLIPHPSSLILKVYTLNISQKELERRVQEFRQMLAVNDRRFRASARALYDLLLKPAQAQLQSKTTLCIVPDGGLWELPFQALQPKENRYLIEDCALFYAPSLTALREMRKRSNGAMEYWTNGNKQHSNTPTLQHSNTPTLLAFGNPSLGKATVERVQLVHRDEKLEPLPEAEREVETLSRLYGTAQSKICVGADASEAQVKSEAGQYHILHFATHGILNDRSPMYSHLMLAQSASQRVNESMSQRVNGSTKKNTDSLTHFDPLGQAEDGLLEAWEIMNLDLKAQLVVLSACQTARGRVGAGEGVIGLTWAVFVAGCPTTVVSQWKVPSRSTTELMLEFHRQLRRKMDEAESTIRTAEALRLAMLKMLRRKDDYRQPFHWAGFVVMGDGR